MEKSKRLMALDAFRGLTIAAMITVNTPGSWSHVYAPLLHSKWHGCTPTDLVFPFFLFAVGVAMFFSFGKFNHQLNAEAGKKILKRTLIIFGIGLLLNAFPFVHIKMENLRIMGVLQRIALAYGIGSLLCLVLNKARLLYVSAAILFSYWGLLYFLGGDHPYSLEGNPTIAFDTMILGASHMYKGFGITFDPEGLFSTLPAIVTVILGYLTGALISKTEQKRIVPTLLVFGVLGFVLGLVWNIWFPINKPLWTSSYVLYAAGLAQLVMAVMIYLIDILNYKKWAHPFLVFGMNPLFIFVLSVVWVKVIIYLVHFTDKSGGILNGYAWLYKNAFASWAGPLNGSLLFALSHIIVYWLIVLYLYKRKIFIKI
ncbi:acyltransferase family protein [Marinifilum sp. RC60d5]|uniref:acyltransferase family protein n=1 Tax=Marinifilum sp. RC60d5 TaxID=3458414 RepID=UPI0040362005